MNNDEKIKKIMDGLKKEGKVLPMTTDVVFKNVLQDEEMKGILSYLISEIIELNYNYVFKNLTFKNTEHMSNKSLEKRKTSDLIVDIDRMSVNLEMNANDNKETFTKNYLYHHTLASSVLKKGEPYKNMRKIIQINFDKVKKYDERIVIKFTMRDEVGKYEIDENYINYHINLAKIYDKWYNKEKLSKFEKILLLMMLEKKQDLIEVSKEDEELELMVRKIFEESEDPNVIGVYDKDEMNAWMVDVAKGYAREEGETKRNLEIAKNMISENLELETISKVTGLSLEEIENLKNH